MSAKFAIILLLSALAAQAQRCGSEGGEPGRFDYYLLALSWAPGFCDTATHLNARECGPGQHLGFVVHGLWPQYEHGRSPEGCAPARPVAHDIVDRMLNEMPDPGLVQHEWACHGTCSGLPVRDYFDLVDRARKTVQIPADLQNGQQRTQHLPVSALEKKFSVANHAPADSFRVVCHSGQLVEVRVCMTKDLKFRPCSDSVRDCPASQVTLLPVQ